MNRRQIPGLTLALLVTTLSVFSTAIAEGGQYLIADRLTNRVLRYSETGDFLGVLIEDSVHLSEPAGVFLNLDESKVYVTSRLNSAVVEYDYAGDSAVYSKSITSTSAAPSAIDAPASVLFSPDGSTMYISNIGATAMSNTVTRLNADGSSAGDLTGGPATGRSGLAFSPSGDLLVSEYGFFGPPLGNFGSVLRYDSTANSFVPFIPNSPNLRGAANMLVNGDDLYLVAGFGGRLGKFDANDGSIDASFGTDGYVSGLLFPASIEITPDGQYLLMGILGVTNGTGSIDRYDLDGNFVDTFAVNSEPIPSQGFVEPTGIEYSARVPEPATLALGILGLVAVGGLVPRQRSQR